MVAEDGGGRAGGRKSGSASVGLATVWIQDRRAAGGEREDAEGSGGFMEGGLLASRLRMPKKTCTPGSH